MQKRRIAIFHELSFGGALRACDALAQELSVNQEIEYFYVTDVKEQSSTTVHSYLFTPAQGKGFVARLRHDFYDLLRLAQLHKKIAREIDSKNFDVVVVHPSQWTQSPFLLSFLKTPSIYYCQEPLRISYDSQLAIPTDLPLPNKIYEAVNRTWRAIVDKKNLACASKILTNSHFTQDWIKRVYGKAASVCYLGVDTQLFSPQELPKRYDVLFLGQPVAIEGFDLLEDAKQFAKTPWKSHVVARSASGKGISDAQLIKTINQSRIVLCLSKNEPFGLGALEAGACCIPVVAVREGGYKETVKNGKNGLLVNRSAQLLAGAIDELLQSPKKLKIMGSWGRENAVENWNWKKSAQALEKHCEALISKEEKGEDVSFLWSREFSAYIFCVGITLFLFRLSFRILRMQFPIPPITGGSVGFSQYAGYPLSFETLLFGCMFISPICIALVFRLIRGLRKS